MSVGRVSVSGLRQSVTSLTDTKEKAIAGRNNSLSLRRALRVLATVSAEARNGSITLTDLAESVAVSKSTVLRLVTPLLEERLLRRDDETGRFSLGDGVLRLGQAYLESLDLRDVAAPFLRGLRDSTHDTCHLVIRDGFDVVYIDKVEQTSTIRMASRIGMRMPIQSTSVGKAIIAFSPPAVLQEVLARGLNPITDHSIHDEDSFRAEIARTRRRGYAIDDRENEPEVRCVGAPIFDHEDAVIGALSVSALSSRMTPARVRELGPATAQVGLRISAAMGSASGAKMLAQ